MAHRFQRPRGQPLPNIFRPGPPRVLNGVELPKADPLVVARSCGIYPTEELFFKEFFKRHQYLDTPVVRRWLHFNLTAYMPTPDPQQPGRGSCGVCSSNWAGHPTLPHSQMDCPIEYMWRARFEATNTRGFCPRCRGKSTVHNNCFVPQQACQQCERNGLPGRWHQPTSGICWIPEEQLEQKFQEIRRSHYEHIAQMSHEEELEVKFYNDAPLITEPIGYNEAVGLRPYIDHEEQVPQVWYQSGASYHGLIPLHLSRDRYALEHWIDKLATDYYLSPARVPEDGSPALLQQITRYKEEVRRVNHQREEPEARNMEMELILAGPPLVAPGNNPPVADYVLPAHGELPGESPQQAVDRVLKALKLGDTYTHQMAFHRTNGLDYNPRDLQDKIININAAKLNRLANLEPEISNTLGALAADAAQEMDDAPPPEERPQPTLIPNKHNIQEYVKMAYWNGDEIQIIRNLRLVLLGPEQPDSPEITAEQFWFRGIRGDLSKSYAELLIRVSTAMAMARWRYKTRNALSCIDLVFGQDNQGYQIIPIPTPQCFVLEPPGFLSKYYYDKYAAEKFRQLSWLEMRSSDQPLSIIADNVVRLLCLDHIQVNTCIQNIRSVDWAEIGRKETTIKDNLLTLKRFTRHKRIVKTVTKRWIRKIEPSNEVVNDPQLNLHVDHYIKLIGFKRTIEHAAKVFRNTIDKLKTDKPNGKRILRQYKEEEARFQLTDPQHQPTRIQAIADIPTETLIAMAHAAGRRSTQTLGAPNASQTCTACFLIGHERGQCSLREEAAYGMFRTEELRQRFQNELIKKLKESETRTSEQSRTDLSNLAPQHLEFDVKIETNIKGAEMATKEKEQTSINSPESTTENGGDYCKTKSDKQSPASLHHERGASKTGATPDNKPIPKDKRSRDSSCLSNIETLDVQTVTTGESNHKDLSKSSSPQRSPQHQRSSHEEHKTQSEPENQRFPRSRHNTSSSSLNSDSEDTSEDPNDQQESLPCQVLSFHRLNGPHIQTKVFARFREYGRQIQMKIGDIMQFHGRIDQRAETRHGITLAAEAIKSFRVQNKGALVPEEIIFFHSCKDFTTDFDKGVKEPFEKILRIVSKGTSPTVNIQETESSTTRSAKEENIVNKLYKDWSPLHPTFRQLNGHEDPASCRRNTRYLGPFGRWFNFVVICSDRVGSSAVTVFARQEDNKNVRLRTVQRDYDPQNRNTKEFSIKVNILEACREISTYIQRSNTSAQIGEILIVHGSKDIELDIQIQRKAPVFIETNRIINRISPKATMWFMKIQENLSKDFSTEPDTLWNWFQTKEKLAYLNPVQEDPSLHETSAQDADSTGYRSSKDGSQEGCRGPLLSSSFQ
ncbi:unnamed protein product [Caenorhabditis brenneri]